MVETVGFHQEMWFVMLEFAKYRISGLDTPEQHVPPRVWYEMNCLLIRNTIGCVMLSCVGMTSYFVISLCDILCELPEPHGARGNVCVGNLSTASGDRLFRKP
jgi:hypothetical protein